MDPTLHPYFRVERSPAKPAGPQWRAAATILRADTDEPMGRLTTKALTAEAAEGQLDAAIETKLAGLEQPRDWGRDPTVPRLLQRYLQLRDEVYGMVERAAPDAEAYEQRDLRKLQAQVEALTDTQLLELVTPTTYELAQLDSPWILDVLTAKKQLSQFISHRSPAVQAGRERLEEALNGSISPRSQRRGHSRRVSDWPAGVGFADVSSLARRAR